MKLLLRLLSNVTAAAGDGEAELRFA